ncbi:hypothetical protein MPSEU_000688900 [Mayamaea pseudoterrestris]|nr:hypothetical protein MPSEU_000688900 [Mayamaea pseudoterrestris]
MGFWTAAWVSLILSRHDKTHSSTSVFNSDQKKSLEYSCSAWLSRSDAAHLIDNKLLPSAKFGARLKVSGAVKSNKDDSKVMLVNDPSLELAYGEFPLQSLDALLDAALKHLKDKRNERLTFLDIGSGAGRICLYASMTRPGWNVFGVEIVLSLHALAVQAADAAVDETVVSSDAQVLENDSIASTIQFFHGPAQEYIHILQQADIIFCYSTVFDATFSPQAGAMVLSRGWMELLQHCRPGTICITTDRCCDPAYGWMRLETVEVENREVMGSTGYVQQLVSKGKYQ